MEKILRAIANDKGEGLGKSLKITGRRGIDQLGVYVKFSWQEIRQRVDLRHRASRIILDTLISCLPVNLRAGQAEVLAEFFITDVMDAMSADIFLAGFKGDVRSLIERCLLYLHDVKIITLQNGLGVFRQAMTLAMLPERLKPLCIDAPGSSRPNLLIHLRFWSCALIIRPCWNLENVSENLQDKVLILSLQ